jgi:aminoglycoside phosphotransferase family enzyme
MSLDAKVACLSHVSCYPFPVGEVGRRETHMSWVFLAGDRVYKLKKPVRLPYLDFSTLDARERACRAELRLNRRLAPDVYLDVVPLTLAGDKIALGGAGPAVDWLVVMRRLDERETLERTILDGRLESAEIDRVGALLVRFYRRAARRFLSPRRHVSEWWRRLAENARILLLPSLHLPHGKIRQVDRTLRRYLGGESDVLAERVRRGRIVDGHGDLRPEHVWLDDRVRIIDCLEFNALLRAVDPLDEIAFLSVECERLGAGWAGRRLGKAVAGGLRDRAPSTLSSFYRCYRAMLRARLAAAHLLEPHPRTPEKWPRLALAYLDIAAAEAVRLDRRLRTPGGRRAGARDAVG